MCGFAGFVGNPKGISAAQWPSLLDKMGEAIAHRGPDDSGLWTDADASVALTHRRLAVLDLSPAGHQPMKSACGQFVIVFNGEIYNHLELRQQLDGCCVWRGHSDTETLLAAFSKWGVRTTLEKCIGMFALALWDRETRSLTLACDRFGEKPLYYGWQGEVFLFGSELKALRAHPLFRDEVNRDALTLLLRHNYIPAPYSIYQNVQKLRPGTYLKVPFGGARNLPEAEPYWSVKQVAETSQDALFRGNDTEAVGALDKLLGDAVRQQMAADVPLGAFLSGGVDSSAVVALMQAQSTRPVKTFTIGFHESGYDEAGHAKLVARHLGTEHTQLYVSPREAMDVIPRLPSIYDEPFADSSQIPTFLVSELARQHVTVSLSGDAGDEVFGGYNRYCWATRIWRSIGWASVASRVGLARLVTSVSPVAWNRLFKISTPFLPASLRYANPGDKLHKLSEILGAKTPEDIYLGLVSHWKNTGEVVLEGREPPTVITDAKMSAALPSFVERMMYFDTATYLPGDILTKVDRAAMAVSLETRVPFLDHRVVEFAWRLPLSMKIREGKRKWILRQVLYKYVPRELIERPKMGFGVPIDSWLRGDLREWAEELLNESRLRQEGYFNPGPIRRKWQEHISGTRSWQYHLWDVLMFQAWLEHSRRQITRASGPASVSVS